MDLNIISSSCTPAAALPGHVRWMWLHKLLAAQEHIAFVLRCCA